MANPVQSDAEVLASTAEGTYRRLVLRAPEAAPRVAPGHFATLAVGGPGSSLLLRRAFHIDRADPAAGTIELVLADHGAGTRELRRARAGDRLALIAPLGTPFPLPEGPVSALLVAEEYGAAALLTLAEEIRRAGGQVGFILGAAGADRLYGVERARALTQDVLVVTADGSAGLPGRVTGPLAQAIAAIDARVVYTAGPAAPAAETARIAQELGVRCWTAVETPMACGTGICMGCVLPVVGADGVSRFTRCCTDGPVFDGARVRWSELGSVPPDLEGAPAAEVAAR
ncbi:dihydroorotate dehydrogenase electron transfer subunit [Kitasatospora sp. NPDC048540]|uniref:iron-sulfur cluster-binding protein n=1 Tax=unclassified Kitasatospora TaxID=2633591 RepID=UPI00053AB8D7|nr:dihydroorotate oxidase [Kitasatospora sp. MBT63]